METSYIPSKNALREFVLWILGRTDIRISTIHIEYFKTNDGDADPIILKFGHISRLEEKNHGN